MAIKPIEMEKIMKAKTKIWKAKKLELLLLIDFSKVVLWFLLAGLGWALFSALIAAGIYEISLIDPDSGVYLIVPVLSVMILIYEWWLYIQYVYETSDEIKEYIKLFS